MALQNFEESLRKMQASLIKKEPEDDYKDQNVLNINQSASTSKISQETKSTPTNVPEQHLSKSLDDSAVNKESTNFGNNNNKCARYNAQDSKSRYAVKKKRNNRYRRQNNYNYRNDYNNETNITFIFNNGSNKRNYYFYL